MSELTDDNKTIFSGDLDTAEKAAVQKGEARGKREYMKEHPKCGLTAATPAYRENYARIDWAKQ